ncbi:hypothetical protein [Deinococcus sedimenti]|uniref:Outer membrane protein beta-barrel domain-containing protein n=1 Tax=Deinococcus sedimenti TaxID=1867090 RepID=A0ABQ2S5K8_9DEIO|nr:hypothetical protein [Deinococcus sedimenti]GGR91449.1 hypothetical protein GCM10008960_18090 [Deinococcus sedimenti]
MKKLLPLTLLTLAATTATAGAQSLNGLELGLTGGYAGGLSGELFVHAPNVVGPVGIKAGVAYTRPSDAINDSAPTGLGGTFGDYKKPTSQGGLGYSESGSQTVVSLDGTYSLGELSPGLDATAYAGGRYGMFRANFGDSSQSTTYTTNPFGLGAGVMVSYALTGGLSLVTDLGVDTYFRSSITTNDNKGTVITSSTGSGDYNAVSNQFVRPGTVFKARIGVKTSY